MIADGPGVAPAAPQRAAGGAPVLQRPSRRMALATLALVAWVGACEAAPAPRSTASATATDAVATTAPADGRGTPSPTAFEPAATPALPALRAVATESTLFNTQRTFRLELHNDGDTTVAIEEIRLASPLFARVPATARSISLAPGDKVLLPLPFGDARCAGDDGAASPGRLEMTVAGRLLDLQLDDRPAGLLVARRDRECAVASVREAVTVELGSGWERLAPRRAAGELVINAEEDTTAVVDAPAGNIVFGLETRGDAFPVEVGPGRQQARIPVTVSADRCDVHALIESKTTFVFSVAVTLDGGEPVVVPFEPTGPARDAVGQLLTACLG